MASHMIRTTGTKNLRFVFIESQPKLNASSMEKSFSMLPPLNVARAATVNQPKTPR